MSAPSVSASRKPLLIALGAVAILALLFWFVVRPLLLEDDDAPGDVGAAPVPSEVATGGETGTVEPGPTEGEVVDGEVQSTFDVFTARDPFEQLVSAAAASPTEQVTDPATGTVTPAPTATPTPTPTPTASTSVEGSQVEMLDTYTSGGVSGANVTVNGNGYTVEEGQSFADGFQLVDVSDGCGTFTHDGSRFVLCIGDTIRK